MESPIVIDLTTTTVSSVVEPIQNRSHASMSTAKRKKRKKQGKVMNLCDDRSEDNQNISSSVSFFKFTRIKKTSPANNNKLNTISKDTISDERTASSKKKRRKQGKFLDLCDDTSTYTHQNTNEKCSENLSSSFSIFKPTKKKNSSPTNKNNVVVVAEDRSASSKDVKKNTPKMQTDLFGKILRDSKSKSTYKKREDIYQAKLNGFNIKDSKSDQLKGAKENCVPSVALLPNSCKFVKRSTSTFEHLLDKAHDVMRETFKLSSLRFLQPIALESVLRGQHQIIIMATGGGKSLCYQLPGTVLSGLTIVICPLISLMLDQVRSLNSKGISAAVLSSSAGREENSKILLKILDPDKYMKQTKNNESPPPKFLYCTPELIDTNNKVRSVLIDIHQKNVRGGLALLAIDESHCLSTWGHEFRPAYRSALSWMRQTFPDVPCIACTATATPKVIEDIREVLKFSNEVPCHLGSFNRPNIFFEVRYKDMLDVTHPQGAIGDLTEVIKEQHDICAEAGLPCSGIVYVHKRSDAAMLAQRISKDTSIIAAPYHAGLSDKDRNETHINWSSGTIDVAVATIAFGMGIDLPHVRYVLHWSMSKSIEGFYQESGRAGRDTKQALSILYYSKSDADKFSFLIRSNLERKQLNAIANECSSSNQADKSKSMESFEKMAAYCSEACCRRQMILRHFGEMSSSAQDICKSTCDYCYDPTKFEKAMKFLSSSTSNTSNNMAARPSNDSKMKNNNTCKDGFVKAGTLRKIMHKQSSSRSGRGGGFIKASKLNLK